MVHFAEINQAPSPYSMLQHIGRVATPKLVPRNCLRYLQTTLKMGRRGIGLRIYVRYCRLGLNYVRQLVWQNINFRLVRTWLLFFGLNFQLELYVMNTFFLSFRPSVFCLCGWVIVRPIIAKLNRLGTRFPRIIDNDKRLTFIELMEKNSPVSFLWRNLN